MCPHTEHINILVRIVQTRWSSFPYSHVLMTPYTHILLTPYSHVLMTPYSHVLMTTNTHSPIIYTIIYWSLHT